MRKLLACAAVLIALPMSASAITAKNNTSVATVGSATYEVVSRRGASTARSFWCAAGEYARDQGARGSDRVYLVSGRQPSASVPGRTAVRFTLTPEAAGVTPIAPQLSLSVDVPGDNMSVAAARQFCFISTGRP